MEKDSKNFLQAQNYLEEALRIIEENYGKNHFELGSILNSLGVIHLNLKNYDETINYYIKAL